MGLLRRAVLLPLSPVEGLLWLGRTLQQVAEDELLDPDALRARLDAAEAAHQAGEIDDDELAAIEDEVLSQLVDLRVIEEGAQDG